jgi:hypothetical protein
VNPDELLTRIAATLRSTVGPEVGDEVAKTQAFMAAVVLEKLAGQVRTAEDRRRADRADGARLETQLAAVMGASPPATVRAATSQPGWAETNAGLAAAIAALYVERDALGPERFEAALARLRRALRARLDRELEYSA